MAKKIHIPWDEEESYDIPDGTKVVFKVTEFNEDETQDGDPKLVLKGVVTAPKQYKGTKLSQSFTIPRGLRYLRPALRALTGGDPPKKASDMDAELVEGKSCYAVVEVSDGWTNLTQWEALNSVDDGIDDDADGDLGDDLGDLDDEKPRTVKVGKHTIELTEESLKKYKVSALRKIAKAAKVEVDEDDDKDEIIAKLVGDDDDLDFDDDEDFPF